MKNYTIGISIILNIILFVLLLNQNDRIVNNTISTIDTAYVDNIIIKDSLVTKIVNKVKLDTVSITKYIAIHNIDTNDIVSDYFTINEYMDTIFIDSLHSITLRENVLMNEIQYRSVGLMYTTPIVTESIRPQPRNAYFVNGGIIANRDHLDYLIGASVVTKKCYTVGIDYGIINKSISLKIGKRFL